MVDILINRYILLLVCICHHTFFIFFLHFRSMLPDVIDDFILKNPESPGHEAIFFSFYVFFTKFASGVSLGISTLSLE